MRVKLFGALRDLAGRSNPMGDAELILENNVPKTVKELKIRLAEILATTSDSDVARLLKVSAVASETRILDETETLPENEAVHILPPVCGG
jgi:molybdopterin converting factor small subunit